MPRFFAESDIDLNVIRGKRIGVIGYGSQGRAQALNLRDSGLDVRVGARHHGPGALKARADGFHAWRASEVAETADVLMLTLPDNLMGEIFDQEIDPYMSRGQTLLFSHGFAIVYGLIEAQAGVDVALVSPKGVGPGLRQNYEAGSGVPALIGVETDATGAAWAIALGYAWGIGSARVMIMETTFREETETDLFGEQAVLCGGIPDLIKTGFNMLVGAGYAPEIAYFECLHEAKLIVDLLYEHGISGMRERISDTAEWGGLVGGPRIIDTEVRRRMRMVLAEIQSGYFADQWIRENRLGRKRLKRKAADEAALPIEQVGRELRRKMGLGDR